MSNPNLYVLSLPQCAGEPMPEDMSNKLVEAFPADQCQPVKCLGPDPDNPDIVCRLVFLTLADFELDESKLPEGVSAEKITPQVMTIPLSVPAPKGQIYLN